MWKIKDWNCVIKDATGEKLSTFIYSKVYQWQYKEATRFVLWIAQKSLKNYDVTSFGKFS
jgi:hypothetical protein